MTDVYLVDDHAMLRDGLRAVLESGGHRVVGETADPAQALADLRRLRPGLLLLDLNLGPHSGLELLAELQRRKQALPTIVLTMSAQPRDVAEALRLGAAGYVLKGSPARDLLAAIEAVAAGRRHLGPQVGGLVAAALDGGAAPSPLASLSARERQIVLRVVRGQSSSAIAAELHLSPKTVDSYRSRLMAKLGIDGVPALVRLAIREGLISAQEP